MSTPAEDLRDWLQDRFDEDVRDLERAGTVTYSADWPYPVDRLLDETAAKRHLVERIVARVQPDDALELLSYVAWSYRYHDGFDTEAWGVRSGADLR